jgi:hypothetical protein
MYHNFKKYGGITNLLIQMGLGISFIIIGALFVQTSANKVNKVKGAKIQIANTLKSISKKSLLVKLTANNNTYKLSDAMSIRVLLINNSNDPISLYKGLDFGESASLSLWITDATSGREIIQNFIADALPPPPKSKNAFITLLPDHIYGVQFKIKIADLSIVRKGKYNVIVEYHSPVPSGMRFGLPVWDAEMGSVSSNVITITVNN